MKANNDRLIRSLNEISQQLEVLIKIKTTDIDTTTMQAHLAQLLVVKSSAFCEQGVRNVIYTRISNAGTNPVVQQVIYRDLKTFYNAKPSKLIEQAQKYNFNNISYSLSKLFEDDVKLKDSIDSLVDLKNKIAHGDETNISATAAIQYMKAAIELVKFWEQQLL